MKRRVTIDAYSTLKGEVLNICRSQAQGIATWPVIQKATKLDQFALDALLSGMLNAKLIERTGGGYTDPGQRVIVREQSTPRRRKFGTARICKACWIEKPIAEFYTQHARCKVCAKLARDAARALLAGATATTPPEGVVLPYGLSAALTFNAANEVSIAPAHLDALCEWWRVKRSA